MPNRPTCYACRRPQDHCLCEAVAKVSNRTPVWIVQHPRERTHPFNTARLAGRCLERVEVLVQAPGRAVEADLARSLAGAGLLYPGPDALDLATASADQMPDKLVVLDGTWRHARSLLRESPALQALPRFTLPAGLKSGFQIRKQPEDFCLSTLEAIHHALRWIEPDAPGLDSMLRPFEAMQSRQLAAMGTRTPRSKSKISMRPDRRFPAALLPGSPSLVVAYAESTTVGPERRPRQLLALAAERPSTGERTTAVLEPRAANHRHLDYLRLSPEDLRQALAPDDFLAQWRAFLRPGDVVAAWSKNSLDLLPELDGLPHGRLLLKGVYLNLRRQRGSLEEILGAEDLMTPAALAEGKASHNRPAERLNHALCLVEMLTEWAQGAQAAHELRP